VTKRDRLIVLSLAGVAILGAFWFLALAPKRQQATKLGAEIADARASLDKAKADIEHSKQAKAGYRDNYATVARLGKAVPTDDDVTSLLYQLDSAARRASVDFRTIDVVPAAASASAPAPAPTPSTGSGSNGSSSGTSGASGSSATPAAAPTQAAVAALPPGVSVGAAGFPTLPLNLDFEGDFFHMADFFREIDDFVVAGPSRLLVAGRLLTIDGFSLAASPKGFPRVEATMHATAFLVPSSEGATGGATPSGPTSGQPSGGTPAGGSASPAVTATATGVAR